MVIWKTVKTIGYSDIPALEMSRESSRSNRWYLAPPRIQLDPIRNHRKSLHFQCPALMRNNARQRRPGGQPRNPTVIGKPSKTIGYSDISSSRAPWSREEILGEDTFVSLFVVGDPRNAYENHSKSLESIAFPSTLAGTRGTARNLGVADRRWPKQAKSWDLLHTVPQS